MASAKHIVRFRVGEKVFFTSRATIENGGRNTLLAAMSDSLWQRDDEAELLIDRNPKYFAVLLDLLRTGELDMPVGMSETALLREASYYGMLKQARNAIYAPLDTSNIQCTTTVPICGVGKGMAITATDDSRCCAVARGNMAYVYDWMLKHHASLDLEYGEVNDVAFLGAQRLLLGTGRQTSTKATVGGMACFDVDSRKVVHRYDVKPDGHPQREDFGVTNIATNNEDHVFGICTYTAGHGQEVGIAMWDSTTGKQIRLLSDRPDKRLSHVGYDGHRRLQWMPDSKLLFVSSDCNHKAWQMSRWFGLFDIRADKFVWPSYCLEEKRHRIQDVIAMDVSSTKTMWAINTNRRVGILDMRAGRAAAGINWAHDAIARSPQLDRKSGAFLACSDSQLIVTVGDSLHLVSSHNWQRGPSAVTGLLKTAHGQGLGAIAVNANRLYTLYGDGSRFEVWETRRDRKSAAFSVLEA